MIAASLNLSRAEVHGMVTFYHEFRRTPPGRHVLRVCRAEACQSVGAEAVGRACGGPRRRGWHGTSADGAVTLEPVFCLGLCATGRPPYSMDEPLGRLDPRGSMQSWTTRDDPDLRAARCGGAGAGGGHGRGRTVGTPTDRSGTRSTGGATGSRGLFWLEPMVEVETRGGPIAYGPVAAPATFPVCWRDGYWRSRRTDCGWVPPENIPFLAGRPD